MTVVMRVGSFTKASVTGDQDITLPSGLPNMTAVADGTWAVVFFGGGSESASGTWVNRMQYMMGMVTKNTTIQQYSVSVYSQNGVTTPNASRRTSNTCCTFVNGAGSGSDADATFVSFPTSTTMRVNWTGATDQWMISYVVITGLTGAKVVTWTTPTATGTKQVTGVGFSPDLVLHAHTVVSAALPTSAANAFLGLGAMNKFGQQWANSVFSADAGAPASSNTSRWQQTDACFLTVNASEATLHQGHYSSMDSDGFSTYFSTVDGGAYHVISLCLDGVTSKIGALHTPTASGSAVSSTRHGFPASGLLMSTIRGGPVSAPTTNNAFGFGASDFTNHRAATIKDDDGQATTITRSMWRSDASIVAGNGTIEYPRGAPTADGLASITVNWSAVDAAAIEVLYCLIGEPS